MAKKQTSGPSLTQRERKQLAKEKAAAAPAISEEEASAEDEKKKEVEKSAQIPRAPPERALIWFYQFYKEHLTTNIFVEFGILGLTVQQTYLAYFPTYEATHSGLNLCISTLCGFIAYAFAVLVIYKSRDQLPTWNTIYLLFLPATLSFIFNKDLLLYNVAFTMTSLDLPIIARFFVQFTVIGSNSDYGRSPVYNSQLIVAHLIINYALSKVSELKSWDVTENNLFSILIIDLFLIKSEMIHVLILQKLIISFSAGLLVIYAINLLLKTPTIFRSLLIISAWSTTFIYLTLYQLNPVLDGDALTWLYNFVTLTETRVKILTVWLGSLLLLIPTIFNYKINLSSNSRRKIWHFLVLILLAYPLYIDPEFVQLSLSGTLVLFLIVEMIRYLNLYPLGEYLDTNLRHFADFRDDQGPIIISYIYLFIGISLPILFNKSAVGLIALGAGDSLASIIGTNIGLVKWANSNKTIEGTMAFILATFFVSAGFKWLDLFFEGKSYHALLLTCTLSGLLEGNSNMNDNIMIPGFMLVLLEVLK